MKAINIMLVVVAVALTMALSGSCAFALAFTVPYVTSAPTIDGTLAAGEWTGTANIVTMTRRDGGGTHPSTLYFQHDGTSLYIGVDSGWGSGWDVLWKVFIDGDYSRTFSGSATAPHIDISCDYPSPGGWGGYNSYWYHSAANPDGVPISNPPGAARASAGSSNVSYEFKIPLADLGAVPGDSVGFYTWHGYDGQESHTYEFPGVYVNQPDQWATLNLVPEPGTVALIAPALLGLAGIAAARRRK